MHLQIVLYDAMYSHKKQSKRCDEVRGRFVNKLKFHFYLNFLLYQKLNKNYAFVMHIIVTLHSLPFIRCITIVCSDVPEKITVFETQYEGGFIIL